MSKIISCPDCNVEIHDSVTACPRCGHLLTADDRTHAKVSQSEVKPAAGLARARRTGITSRRRNLAAQMGMGFPRVKAAANASAPKRRRRQRGRAIVSAVANHRRQFANR